jgi:hypothetical protein
MPDPIAHLIEAIEAIATQVLAETDNLIQLVANDLTAAALAAEEGP